MFLIENTTTVSHALNSNPLFLKKGENIYLFIQAFFHSMDINSYVPECLI